MKKSKEVKSAFMARQVAPQVEETRVAVADDAAKEEKDEVVADIKEDDKPVGEEISEPLKVESQDQTGADGGSQEDVAPDPMAVYFKSYPDKEFYRTTDGQVFRSGLNLKSLAEHHQRKINGEKGTAKVETIKRK